MKHSYEFMFTLLAKYMSLVGDYEGVDFVYKEDYTEEEYSIIEKAQIASNEMSNARIDLARKARGIAV